MKTTELLFAAVLLAATPLAIAAVGHAAHAQGHEHAETAVDAPAKRHAADATLSGGMGRIRAEVGALAAPADQPLAPAERVRHAAAVEAEVHRLIETCKLEPEADAQLHAIIVPLLAAARQLQEKPADAAPIAAMRAALAEYPKRFEDPEWAAGTD